MYSPQFYTLQCVDLYKDKLEKTLTKILSHQDEIQPIEIFLFGSVARGTYNAQSDLDLCILTDLDSRKVSSLLELYDIRDDIGYPKVDVIIRRPIDLENKQYAIHQYMLRDKLVLWKKED